METFYFYLTIVTTVYEMASRVIPTTRTWSIVGNVLKALHFISEKVDNKK